MFVELINLYNRNFSSGKTPLEDFNTESFANILKLYSDIRNDYFFSFLNLPQDEYQIITQYKKYLPKGDCCIVDLVLIGEKNVCFIENKIESFESSGQLKRYGEILDFHFPNCKKILHYCTKYSDPKNTNSELNKYHFRQYKWFQVAKFLKQYVKTNPLIDEYINFLSKYKMAQDNTFKVENLLTLENLLKTIEISEFHINNSKDNFNKLFGSKKYNTNFNWAQLKEHNRFSHYKENIIISPTSVYSEILYSIEFSSLKLNCHIFLLSNHEEYDLFRKINLSNTEFKLNEYDYGANICLEEDLGYFLNDNNSDSSIKQWFSNSFNFFNKLINNNPQINWNK
jgi:hypothetical protein